MYFVSLNSEHKNDEDGTYCYVYFAMLKEEKKEVGVGVNSCQEPVEDALDFQQPEGFPGHLLCATPC